MSSAVGRALRLTKPQQNLCRLCSWLPGLTLTPHSQGPIAEEAKPCSVYGSKEEFGGYPVTFTLLDPWRKSAAAPPGLSLTPKAGR